MGRGCQFETKLVCGDGQEIMQCADSIVAWTVLEAGADEVGGWWE